MSNRRSLIGEVSLPKISEKVWNRINVELFDVGKMYTGSVSIDYVVSENIYLIVEFSDNEKLYITSHAGTNYTFTEIGFAPSQGVTVTSWTPLEDDNYKYIVFPMYLEVGDNGDKGKVLFEYLSSLDNKIINEMYIGTIKIHNFNVISDRQCYLYPSQGDSYQLNIDGVITKTMTEPV